METTSGMSRAPIILDEGEVVGIGIYTIEQHLKSSRERLPIAISSVTLISVLKEAQQKMAADDVTHDAQSPPGKKAKTLSLDR